MANRQQTRTSLERKSDHEIDTNHVLAKKKIRAKKKVHIGVIIGLVLTLITIAVQCIAFFTPHWKEVSSRSPSLYVDGVDALIRTEVLHYFDSVHRSTHLSYGLFQRCEYLHSNASSSNPQRDQLLGLALNSNRPKQCTRNFLPAFRDEDFDECHSLPYYRFCTKANENIFDINHNYLRATYDVSSSSKKVSSTSSCDCRYPPYVKACHIIGIFALIFLCLTSVFFSLFLFVRNAHHRLRLKCFGGLLFVLTALFLLTNLLLVAQHLQYESIEYLIAIERHYKQDQIYKLSQDTRVAIDRFLSSIRIQVGYSTVLGWIAFVLSVIDAVFFMATCKVRGDHEGSQLEPPSGSLPNDENSAASVPLTFAPLPSESPFPPPLPIINESNETDGLPPKSYPARTHQTTRYFSEDAVWEAGEEMLRMKRWLVLVSDRFMWRKCEY